MTDKKDIVDELLEDFDKIIDKVEEFEEIDNRHLKEFYRLAGNFRDKLKNVGLLLHKSNG